jgi:hypothetical protein
MRRLQAHRTDEREHITPVEFVGAVACALVIIAALYGLLIVASAVWG